MSQGGPRLAPALSALTLSALAFGGSWVTAEPGELAGRAVAASGVAAEPDAAARAAPRQASWLAALAEAVERPAGTRPTGVRPAARPPAPAPDPAPRPARATQRRPGTIVLAEGGTARLVRAEVGSDGTLPIPSGVDQATWWGVGLGSRNGATVFAGHVDWAGATGPFAELWRARLGDRVAVVDGGGRTWGFRVSRVLTLGKHELPGRAAALFGPSGKHRVVLVTCGGRWVGGSDGYSSNRIVVATPAT